MMLKKRWLIDLTIAPAMSLVTPRHGASHLPPFTHAPPRNFSTPHAQIHASVQMSRVWFTLSSSYHELYSLESAANALHFPPSACSLFLSIVILCYASPTLSRLSTPLVSPLAIAVGCSNIYLSCHSRPQTRPTSVLEAPPIPTWPTCCPCDLTVRSRDPSATIPTYSPALLRKTHYWLHSAMSPLAMPLHAHYTHWGRREVAIGLTELRTLRL
jgi:hypothetical protein